MTTEDDRLKRTDGPFTADAEPCPVCSGCRWDTRVKQTFQGVPHYFCSERCQRRFSEHPHLYVGSPHHGLSIKQQGKTVVKTHIIRLACGPDETLQRQLFNRLEQVGGVLGITIQEAEIAVSYDLVCVSLCDIELEVERIAGALKSTLAAKAKRQAIHFAEECELDNLAHLSSSGKQYEF